MYLLCLVPDISIQSIVDGELPDQLGGLERGLLQLQGRNNGQICGQENISDLLY